MILQKGDTFEIENYGKITVLDLLGDGGQGEVYLVSSDLDNKKYALKIYKDDVDCDFWYNLKNNVSKGSPAPTFLWPKALVETDDGIYGYLMDLRPKEYKSFVSYLTGGTKFHDVETLLRWCITLCLSFKLLHEKGYSYQDLNDGSFFLNPDTGSILICDNDNVTANKQNLGILGKMKYMAPEILKGEIDPQTGERQMPDVHSDRFSLAVILFYALCMGHPYEGERLKKYEIIDENAEYELYGSDPVFIYHKTDRSNRPIRGYHYSVIKRWPLIPLYIKEAFHKTFVDGLTDRENSRVTEIEWIKLLTRYRDELVYCGCGFDYAYGLYENKPVTECPICKRKKNDLCILEINKSNVVLMPGKHLYATHFDKYSSNYNHICATVIPSKNNPNIWGIRLNNNKEYVVEDRSGHQKVIAPNGVIPIVRGLKIKENNNIIGEIK